VMADIVDKGYIIVGSPDEVAEQLKSVATDLNVGHMMFLMHFGNMSREVSQYNTKLFAEKVMPQLRGLFGDWEDKWWPKPLARGQRASVPAFRPQLAAAE